MWAFSLIFFSDHSICALCSCLLLLLLLLLLFYLFAWWMRMCVCWHLAISVYVYGFEGWVEVGWWNLPASIDSNIPNPSIGTVGNLLYMWYLDIFGIWCIFVFCFFVVCCYKYKYEVYECVCVYVKPRRRRSSYCDVVVYCLFFLFSFFKYFS